jgi:hypothetical protein
MGYFLEDFAHHVFVKERTSDFWEMNLHHLMTVTLYGGMILQNFIRVGIVVSWLHSVPDIFIAGSRVLSQTHYKICTVISFGICLFMWMYFRNYVMPLVSYAAYQNVIYPEELAPY